MITPVQTTTNRQYAQNFTGFGYGKGGKAIINALPLDKLKKAEEALRDMYQNDAVDVKVFSQNGKKLYAILSDAKETEGVDYLSTYKKQGRFTGVVSFLKKCAASAQARAEEIEEQIGKNKFFEDVTKEEKIGEVIE